MRRFARDVLILCCLVPLLAVSCSLPGLAEDALEEIGELREEIGEISDGFQEKIDNICDTLDSVQGDYRSACEGVANNAERERCEEIAEERQELLRQLEEACEENR